MADRTTIASGNRELPIAGQDTLIDLTEAAVTEIRRRLADEALRGHHLRVGVEGGGCSGLMYQLAFDNEVGKFDKLMEVKGIPVVVDLKSALYLRGTVIDFVSALVGGGFKFSNPNATKACGCGTSFSA